MAITAYSPSFDPGPAEVRRMNRLISWSVVVHIGLVALLLLTPRSWWAQEDEPREVMTINLGGTPGPVTTGQTNVGGRTVEQVAPPPRRPEPVRPTPPTPPAATAAPATRTPPRPVPSTAPAITKPTTPPSTAKPQPAAPVTTGRPPVTGPQVQQGNNAVDTGATGQGAGLSSGGRIAGGEATDVNFCCPDYLDSLLTTIDSRWNKNQPERGTTILKFTVRRDGGIENIVVERSSGYGTLDRVARGALQQLRLPPLPAAYTRDTLTVHLTFPYGSS